MRIKPPAVLPLFRSELQLRLLGLLLLNPEDWWTADELERRLKASPASVHRELHRSLSAGIVRREALGRTFRYRAETLSPLYEPLTTLLERTVGLEAELRSALGSLPGVEAAVLYGSYAGGTKIRPTSDVDVLVLGDVDIRAARRRIREIERRSGREIDVVAFSPEEFRNMLAHGNAFARDVVRGPLKELVGSLHSAGYRGNVTS